MSIKESTSTSPEQQHQQRESGATSLPVFGICFADTSTGEFNLVQIEDDADRTQLETLLMQIRPRELVTMKGNLAPATSQRIKSALPTKPLWNKLTPHVEFWDADTTVDFITARDYFKTPDAEQWPQAVQTMLPNKATMSALGGMISYLEVIKLASTLLPMQNFHIYTPMAHASTLVLDGQTLRNLEIFGNSIDGSEEGTLWQLVNQCQTAMGKRQLKRWVCHPLSGKERIDERNQSVAYWEAAASTEGADLCDLLRDGFNKLPDLERSVSRIFNGTAKLKEFLNTLDAFGALQKLMHESSDVRENALTNTNRQLIKGFPAEAIEEHLRFFQLAFDHRLAREEGVLIPARGVEADFDAIEETIEALVSNLEACRRAAQKQLGCTVDFRDLGKEIYLMEVPTSKAKAVPTSWKRSRGTKAIDRYYTPETEPLVNDLKEAQETRSQVLAGIKAKMYQKFSGGYNAWLMAIRQVAELDCLMALAKAGDLIGAGGVTCRATIMPDAHDHDDHEKKKTSGVLQLENMRHPCASASSGHDYVPNSTELGVSHAMILLTGPNAGGKSTLLRQTCIAVLLSHLGCRVPAKRMTCTAFDRIYTRIGANDNILAGQSTFMVELAETAKILSTSTPRSLVILDELGRGTSTFDGYAIAWAVMAWLIREGGCIGLFSTHYGMLTEEYAHHPMVKLMHMACHVDDDKQDVTFLYKLTPGVCPKSYGMNVARMAGIDERIVEEARAAAEQFEADHRIKQQEQRSAAASASAISLDAIQRENVHYAWSSLSDPATALAASGRRGLHSVMRAWAHLRKPSP